MKGCRVHDDGKLDFLMGGGVARGSGRKQGVAACMGMPEMREMGGAGGQRISLCHPPGAQLGPPCYQYDNQGSRTAENVASYNGDLRSEVSVRSSHVCSPYC